MDVGRDEVLSLRGVLIKINGEGYGFFLDDEEGLGAIDRMRDAEFIDEEEVFGEGIGD